MQNLHSKYKLGKIIGSGGMGRVYLGYNIQTKEKVAIKQIIFPANTRSQTRERAIREYEFLSAINHPNIVKAYDFYEIGDHIFLVMEYAEGVSLEEIIQNKPSSLSLKEQLAIAIQISQAVYLINTAGIIHRDIKPLNIMVDERRKNVKLLDLGLGKDLEHRPNDLTQGGAVGTPAYMSPEQIEGLISKNSDVFSVGTTLYQFFAWAKLSPFQKATTISTWNAVTNRNVPSLWEILPQQAKNEVPIYQKISLIVEKCLEKDAQNRLPSCKDLVDELATIFYELKTDSTTIIYDDTVINRKWKPSIEVSSEEIRKLQKLRAKYGSDFDLSRSKRYIASRRKQRQNQYIYIVMFCFLLTGLVIGVTINRFAGQETEEKQQATVKLSVLEKKLQDCILAAQQKQFQECARQLSGMENIRDHKIYTGDPLCKLVSYVYRGKWKRAFELTPAVLRAEKYGAVGVYYCLRTFACLGQYHLLLVYSDIFARRYPQLQPQIFHPVCYYPLGQFENAFFALGNWNPHDDFQQQEKNINDAFLQYWILHSRDKGNNWKHLENFVAKNLDKTVFAHMLPLLKAHATKNHSKVAKLSRGLFSLYPELTETRYFYTRSKIKENKEQLAQLYHTQKDYPHFFLVNILLGKWSQKMQCNFTFNKPLFNAYADAIKLSIKVYAKDDEKLSQLVNFMENGKDFMDHQSKIEKIRGNKATSTLYRWQAIRRDPLQISFLNKGDLQELPLEQQLLLLLDLNWYFYRLQRLDKFATKSFKKKIAKAHPLFREKIPQLVKKKPNIFSMVKNYHTLPGDFLLNLYKKSGIELQGQILRCLLAQNHPQFSQVLKNYKGKDAHKLNTWYSIDQICRKFKDGLSSTQAHQLLKKLQKCQEQDPRFYYDSLYQLELLRIRSLLQKSVDDKVLKLLYDLAQKTSRYSFFHSKRFPTQHVYDEFVKYLPVSVKVYIRQANLYRKLQKMALAYRHVQFGFYLLKLTSEQQNWYRQLENLEQSLLKVLEKK
ncbi:serine/threonine-protein kinase [Candidatus Uabimicrobium amorphum]|uniref:Protein kinase n=1 Tax=Uabimicrobium amorphum TaxID=2596890 RepID=A0A5S9IR10_UABAM|nr:serine/threonine-protein kinase [Candidatus Uabimicrobium amorphum]BBM85871.1 protein kinase [Candidatus Uabimicrobium amorphum]